MLGKFLTKKGWREIGGKRHYYKSKWEMNYAKFLEWQKKKGMILDWEYEPDTFWFEGIRRGCVSYLPDFKITWMDGKYEYHEIKGWMDPKSATRVKRFRKYFPQFKLFVIGKKEYQQLEEMLFRIVPEWES